MTKKEAINLIEKEIQRYRTLMDMRTVRIFSISLDIIKEIDSIDEKDISEGDKDKDDLEGSKAEDTKSDTEQ